MLNARQIKDSQKCEEMQEKNQSMDCLGCSCSVCLAQQPSYYKIGFKKAISIIEEEIEIAKN